MSGPQRRRPTVLIIIGAALVLGLVAAAIRPDWHFHPLAFDLPHTGPRPTPAEMGSRSGTPAVHPADRGNAGRLAVVSWILLGLMVAVAAVITWVLIRRLFGIGRARPPARSADSTGAAADDEPDLPTMRRGALAAQGRMTENMAPSDAIVAGWLELEDAAAGSGVSRSPAQTPTEFTADVLARTAADRGATQSLLRLYLRARFSTMTITADDVARARHCIHDIAGSWDHR